MFNGSLKFMLLWGFAFWGNLEHIYFHCCKDKLDMGLGFIEFYCEIYCECQL